MIHTVYKQQTKRKQKTPQELCGVNEQTCLAHIKHTYLKTNKTLEEKRKQQQQNIIVANA